jgi:hypothetical protein
VAEEEGEGREGMAFSGVPSFGAAMGKGPVDRTCELLLDDIIRDKQS